jgi:hypothetical protein
MRGRTAAWTSVVVLAGLGAGSADFSASTAPATALEPALPPNDPSAALVVHRAAVRTLAVRSLTMVTTDVYSKSPGQGIQTIVYQAPDRVEVTGKGIQQVFVGSTTYLKVPPGSALSGTGGGWLTSSLPSRTGLPFAREWLTDQEWLPFVSSPGAVQRVGPDIFRVETVRAVPAAPRPFTTPAGFAEVVLTVTLCGGRMCKESGSFSAPGEHERFSIRYSRFDNSPPVTTPAAADTEAVCSPTASTPGFPTCRSATYSTP